MRDLQYFEASHLTVNTGGSAGLQVPQPVAVGWELLLRNTAANALHDSGARYDAPKCDEDTRVEVIGEIMDWIMDRDVPQRVLCMTGAAGAGKSALQQTTAEICLAIDSLASSFFFSSSDPTRNTAERVIPTIAYQLGRNNAVIKHWIDSAVDNDGLIFLKSLQAQMEALIVIPFQRAIEVGVDLSTVPYAILIDGLDECNGEDHQAELLTAIRKCLRVKALPFRFFIASRPEWAIRTALEPGGHLHKLAYHIQLSDKYDATEDMRRYLRRRFEAIGFQIGDPRWFSDGDVDILVKAASGQFIYAATVFKYISERRTSPPDRLRIVLTWTPHQRQVAKPFKALDRLYANILRTAKDTYEVIDTNHERDFLLLFRAQHLNGAGPSIWMPWIASLPADSLSVLLGLESRAEEILISDLHSLVVLERDKNQDLRLHMYHKSFSDFLDEESRSKDLFIPPSRVHTHLAKCLMQHIIDCPVDLDSIPDTWEQLPLPRAHQRSLRESVKGLPFFLWGINDIENEIVEFTQKGGWDRIDKLMPLLFRGRISGLLFKFEDWREHLRQFSANFHARHPELAVVILEFVAKWERDDKEWDIEWKRRHASSSGET
ncbi:hypothetical protein MD484_g1710, partial [Candolleomyces efflorescens]